MKKMMLCLYFNFFVVLACLPLTQQYHQTADHYLLEPIELSKVVEYRHQHLHQGLDESISHFPNDDAPSTVHLGVRNQNELIGVISLINEDPFGVSNNPDIWRLRGLCVSKGYRGKGIGSRLLREVAKLAQNKGAKVLWGNARAENKAFFLGKGAKIDAGPFELPDWPNLGRFYRMSFVF